MARLRYTYASLGRGSTAQANFSHEDEHYVMPWCEDNDGDVTTMTCLSHLGNSTGMCNPYLYPHTMFAFACEHGIFHTVPTCSCSPDSEYSPPFFTPTVTLGQRHNNNTTTMRSLSPPSPLPSPSSSATTQGQKCACSYDDAKTTTM
jgi:hypothetical protein